LRNAQKALYQRDCEFDLVRHSSRAGRQNGPKTPLQPPTCLIAPNRRTPRVYHQTECRRAANPENGEPLPVFLPWPRQKSGAIAIYGAVLPRAGRGSAASASMGSMAHRLMIYPGGAALMPALRPDSYTHTALFSQAGTLTRFRLRSCGTP